MNVMIIKFRDRIPKMNSTKVAEFWDKKAKSLLKISLNFYKNITSEGAKIFFAYLKHSLNWLHQRSMWKLHHQLWSQKYKFCNIPTHIRDQKLKEYIRWISTLRGIAKTYFAKFTESWGKNQEIYYTNICKNDVNFGLVWFCKPTSKRVDLNLSWSITFDNKHLKPQL